MKEAVRAPSPDKAAQKVGDAKGHEKGVRSHPCPEELGHDHVAEETENPGEERRPAYDSRRSGNRLLFTHGNPSSAEERRDMLYPVRLPPGKAFRGKGHSEKDLDINDVLYLNIYLFCRQ